MTARNYASLDFSELMNALVGSLVHYKDDGTCANIYSTTSTLDVVNAFNRKLGTTNLDLPDVLSRLAGFSHTVDVNVALARLVTITTGTSVTVGTAASGIGTAFNPTINISGGILSANAGNAAGTGSAFNAVALATGSVAGGLASGTGAAFNPSISLAQPAGAASGTGSAKDATISSGVAWTPASLPSLVAWFDASNAGSITSAGGLVSQWNDLSGNGFHVSQGTGSQQPTTGSVTQNSLNAIGFQDANDKLINASFTFATNACSFYVVAKMNTTGIPRQVSWKTAGASDYNSPLCCLAISALGNETYYNSTSVVNGASFGTTAFQYTMFRSGATFSGRKNQAAVTGSSSSVTTAFAPTQLIFGQTPDDNGGSFNLCEVILCSVQNSTGDRDSAEAYLKAKWGTP